MPESTDTGPVYRVHTACDVEKYSAFLHEDQHFVQAQLNAVLNRAARSAQVDRANAFVQPTGDGDLTRWSETVTASDILAAYVPAVHQELLTLNRKLADDRQIRLRLAVTAGTSERGELGLVGTAPVNAARLVNAQITRAELAVAPGHPLVVIVDEPIYQDVVAPGVRHLSAAAYRRVVVTDSSKPSFTRTAWITVPGRWLPDPSVPPPDDTIEEPEEPGSSRGWRAWSKPVKAAVITATGTVVAALITAAALSINNTPQQPANDYQTSAPMSPSTPTPKPVTSDTTGKPATVRETAGNHRGSQTFADTAGKVSSAGSIPYGTEVDVSCVAPNLSGMSSINAFYRIETAPWRGLYAPANTFMNGDPPGTAGTHDVDPAVKACPQS